MCQILPNSYISETHANNVNDWALLLVAEKQKRKAEGTFTVSSLHVNQMFLKRNLWAPFLLCIIDQLTSWVLTELISLAVTVFLVQIHKGSMAPTKKSRSVNKRLSNSNDLSPEKDGVNSNKYKLRVCLNLLALLLIYFETASHRTQQIAHSNVSFMV